METNLGINNHSWLGRRHAIDNRNADRLVIAISVRGARRRRGDNIDAPPLSELRGKLGMRELIKFGDLGLEDINSIVITTRTVIAQQRDTVLRFLRAFTRGMHRYRTDKEYSKRVLGKYGKITDDEILEGAWQDYAPTLQKSPRPSLKAIQFLIENQFPGKKPLPKPEQFVDSSLVDQLEKRGFIDSIYK